MNVAGDAVDRDWIGRPPETALRAAVATELARLLRAVATRGSARLTEVDAELVQADGLLAEAVDGLAEAFTAIGESVDEQHRLLGAAGAAIGAAPVLQAARDRLAGRVGQAVSCLQFQDITSQLIAGTRRRVDALRGLLGEVAGAMEAIEADVGGADPVAAMAGLVRLRALCDSALAHRNEGPVRQRGMDSGEAELFQPMEEQ